MGRKIMIVEDSNLMIAVIKRFIITEFPDTVFVEARSGEESLVKYAQEKPDLVFMDIVMPGMDGITALEHIRKSDSHAKIVMCTSLKETAQETRAKNAGCVGYITKPFSKADIVSSVQSNT